MNEWKKGVVAVTRVFNADVGYLRIPSMPIRNEDDFNTKAQELNDSLCLLFTKNIKGLILDLRLNGGGAMHPMILGLHNLLQPGTVGAFYDKGKEDWVLSDTSFSVNGVIISKIVPKCTANGRSMPVVLLIGSGTGSSGEFMIIPFKTRPNTKLLGTITSGYVTAVTGMQLSNTAFMNLSVSYGGDNKGKIYREAFAPDVIADSPDKFNDLENDEKIRAAIRLIKSTRN
jgi:C-terminal processing protease CtpA/Prc